MAGPECFLFDVAYHPAFEDGADFCAALDGGNPAYHGLGLDVLQYRLAVGMTQCISWQADRWLIVRVARPWLPGGPGHRPVGSDPQRQAVVGDVVVQIDQAGGDDPFRLDLCSLVKATGCWRRTLLNGLDDAVTVDVQAAVWYLGPGRV